MAGGARGPRRLLITLLVLVVLLVVVDRGGNYVAERIAGNALKDSQNLPSAPDVSIDDIPFLTQFASGNYGQVTITAHDVPLNVASRQLDVSQVRVVLHDVSVSRSFKSFRARTAAATATLDYPALGRAVRLDLRYAGNGRIETGKTISILGRQFDAQITTTPELVNGALAFGSLAIGGAGGAGSLGGSAAEAVQRAFGLKVPLSGLPFDVTVRSVRATAQGVEIGLTGANLSYSG